MTIEHFDGFMAVCFGTSDVGSFQSSFLSIFNDCANAISVPAVMAVSSERVRMGLEKKGIKVNDVEHAFFELEMCGCKNILVESLYLANGTEYSRMIEQVERYRNRFESMIVSEPLLDERADDLADILCDICPQTEDGSEYILLGHGSKNSENKEYSELEEKLVQRSRGDVHVMLAEAGEPLSSTLTEYSGKKLIFLPLMFCSGHHIKEIYEELPEICESLEIEYTLERRGLGEHDSFRKLFLPMIKD